MCVCVYVCIHTRTYEKGLEGYYTKIYPLLS